MLHQLQVRKGDRIGEGPGNADGRISFLTHSPFLILNLSPKSQVQHSLSVWHWPFSGMKGSVFADFQLELRDGGKTAVLL